MTLPRAYVGLPDDEYGGMTPTGQVVRDARVFGLIPENETCAGWPTDQIQLLYDRVTAAWEQFGHLVSRMPPELRERHARIFDEAVRVAREHGWDPELRDEE